MEPWEHLLISLMPQMWRSAAHQQTPGTYCTQQRLKNQPSSHPALYWHSKNLRAETKVSVCNAKKSRTKLLAQPRMLLRFRRNRAVL